MCEDRLLLAVIPPGSIAREVSALQGALFSARGCLSAVALAPLIPAAFLPADARVSLSSLVRVASAVFRAVGWARAAGWLYIALETGGAWDALRSRVPAISPSPLFPVHQGFFMGCGEDGGEGVESGLPTPRLSFSSGTLALVRLAPAADAWWRGIYMEVIEKVPLR